MSSNTLRVAALSVDCLKTKGPVCSYCRPIVNQDKAVRGQVKTKWNKHIIDASSQEQLWCKTTDCDGTVQIKQRRDGLCKRCRSSVWQTETKASLEDPHPNAASAFFPHAHLNTMKYVQGN